MALSPTSKAAVQAEIDLIDSQLAAANATLLSLLGQKNKRAEVDTGEASENYTRWSLKELRETISQLKDQKQALESKLKGTGIIRLAQRRRLGS